MGLALAHACILRVRAQDGGAWLWPKKLEQTDKKAFNYCFSFLYEQLNILLS